MPMRPKHKNTGVKMVLGVRTDLKMKSGKIGAQCGHATLGLYQQVIGKKKYEQMLKDWGLNGTKKICVKIKDEAEMNLLVSRATDANIAYYVVQDAGRTQVAAGSRTVIALVDYENKLNTITGRLKLM